ncbi:MAG: HD domain-containing protein [Firmicutes bacterium]|nr:HD domain-containing protein [Bacillota bacterium]
MNKVLAYNPKADLEFLRRAYDYAAEAHREQKRFSGEPFIVHPLEVANILAELELDLETLVAGLLHDVVEDTGVKLAELERLFGREVAMLVDGVTKLSRIEYKSKEEQQAENLRKMFLAMAKDIRVILIKLADRLHNLRTLKYHPAPKQVAIARETLEIFAPLAHRLGIYRIKWELEDLSFRFMNPVKYFELAEKIAKTRSKREEYLRSVISMLMSKLAAMGIEAEIKGRPKHLYSIYEKMVELDVPAMIHVSTSCNACFHTTGAHYINADTTAFMQLIQGDLFKDFPTLRFIIPHGGGAAPYHWGRYRGLAQELKKPPLAEHLLGNVFFDTCVYHQPGIDLLTRVVPVDNILFASEMIGAVRGIDPQTGHHYDDTKRYVLATPHLDEAARRKVFEDNARRVFPRLDAQLKARGL